MVPKDDTESEDVDEDEAVGDAVPNFAFKSSDFELFDGRGTKSEDYLIDIYEEDFDKHPIDVQTRVAILGRKAERLEHSLSPEALLKAEFHDGLHLLQDCDAKGTITVLKPEDFEVPNERHPLLPWRSAFDNQDERLIVRDESLYTEWAEPWEFRYEDLSCHQHLASLRVFLSSFAC
ncbi:hypothetical protein P7C73_g95, partial [Tremellales sp. Uapishka_1]